MTPAQADLARALVALPGWEWPDGMAFLTGVDAYPLGFLLPAGTRLRIDKDAEDHRAEGRLRNALPDLTDDATAGALLGMLRATGHEFCLSVAVKGPGWFIELDSDPVDEPSIFADTLGEAVAGALVAIGRCS